MTHVPASKRRLAETLLHDRDLHAWSLEQARLLKTGRFREIDAENLAEEILDVGSAEYDKLESALRVILVHMLKWDHQPKKRSRSWENTIEIQRRHVTRQLKRNPSLKSRIEEAVTEAYFDARRLASSETDLAVASFPENCPYEWDEILTRTFER